MKAVVSKSRYRTGVEVSEEEMKSLSITYDKFHPEWNYTIKPRRKRKAASRQR